MTFSQTSEVTYNFLISHLHIRTAGLSTAPGIYVFVRLYVLVYEIRGLTIKLFDMGASSLPV
jgi:hypothetical protein